MTDKEINIKIAKACGWTFVDFRGIILCREPEWEAGKARTLEAIPDYCKDLNAMHEAEKMLTEIQCAFHRQNLQEIITDIPASMYVWHATARQRAEAFLRTINLWKP